MKLVEKRVNLMKRRDTFNQEIEPIKNGRWPPGIKPFSVAYECADLDLVEMAETKDND